MDRAKRIGEFWSYLPTFRLVAELESASGAARALGLTPSAVSRAVSALETSLGQPLFNRAGRELVLNDAGALLLSAVRTSMRSVDEGLAALSGGKLVGPIRVSAWEPVASCAVPQLFTELLKRHPGLVPSLTRIARDRVPQSLLDGTTDLVLATSAPGRRSEELAVRRIASCKTSVYARRGHAVATKGQLSLRALEQEGFVALRDEGGAWPVEAPRSVRVVADDVDSAARIAASAGLLVVLPDVYVASLPALELVRIPSTVPRPLSIYAVWRVAFDKPSRAEIALELAAEILGKLEAA